MEHSVHELCWVRVGFRVCDSAEWGAQPGTTSGQLLRWHGGDR